jgi:hypothetical protein
LWLQTDTYCYDKVVFGLSCSPLSLLFHFTIVLVAEVVLQFLIFVFLGAEVLLKTGFVRIHAIAGANFMLDEFFVDFFGDLVC